MNLNSGCSRNFLYSDPVLNPKTVAATNSEASVAIGNETA